MSILIFFLPHSPIPILVKSYLLKACDLESNAYDRSTNKEIQCSFLSRVFIGLQYIYARTVMSKVTSLMTMVLVFYLRGLLSFLHCFSVMMVLSIEVVNIYSGTQITHDLLGKY